MTRTAWTADETALFSRLMAEGRGWPEIAPAFPERPGSAVRLKFSRLAAGRTARDATERTFESKEGKARVSVTTGEEVRTLADLVRVCGIDTAVYEVVGWGCRAWNGFVKNEAKRPETVQLFSVHADLRPKRLAPAVRAELDALVEEARGRMAALPAPPRRERPGKGSGVLLCVNLTDLHMGKYAWGKETGADYDADIAERLLGEALADLVAKAGPWRPERIVLTVGSDLLNADNSGNTTTAGTPQSTDGRQQRTFRRTWQLMRRAILRLLETAPVHLVVVNGNHDRDASFAVGEVLSVAFEGHPDVTVDNGAPRRKYVEWGRCLLGFTHGDEIRTKDIPGVMAEECAEAWGRTRWRAMETGHLHQQSVTEFPGVIVRVNPALCAPEDWHHAKGFVGKVRALQAQVWHKEDGNVASLSSSPVAPARSPVVNVAA